MPGPRSFSTRDLHTTKTAVGATAAPPGTQPILVQTEYALADESGLRPALDRDASWREPLFPGAFRTETISRAAGAISSGNFFRARPTRAAARRRLIPAPLVAPAPEPAAQTGATKPPDRAASRDESPSRKRTVRLCRRRAINEKGNARQCAATGGKPDCHRRELGSRRALHRAQQSRKLRGEHLQGAGRQY